MWQLNENWNAYLDARKYSERQMNTKEKEKASNVKNK